MMTAVMRTRHGTAKRLMARRKNRPFAKTAGAKVCVRCGKGEEIDGKGAIWSLSFRRHALRIEKFAYTEIAASLKANVASCFRGDWLLSPGSHGERAERTANSVNVYCDTCERQLLLPRCSHFDANTGEKRTRCRVCAV